jgi:tetratricopeptide (TPR) repeat protein
MLQDIDRRLGAANVEGFPRDAAIRVAMPPPVSRRDRIPPVLLAALACIAVPLAWNAWRTTPDFPPPASAVRIPVPAVSSSSAASAEKRSPPRVESSETFQRASQALRLTLELSPVAAPSTPAAVPAPAPPAGDVRPSLRIATVEPVRPAAAPTPAPTPVKAQRIERPVRQVAAEETIADARLQWSTGARTGAIATLREALSAAEGSRDPAAVKALAYELALFEVADNRLQPALDLLRRMETLFAGDGDALALRANIEQRLGQHGEAAQSYLAALGARPEAKWMIGAAISLVATGQREQAQEWVDRARQRGAVTPAIAAYLQQLGLSTRP